LALALWLDLYLTSVAQQEKSSRLDLIWRDACINKKFFNKWERVQTGMISQIETMIKGLLLGRIRTRLKIGALLLVFRLALELNVPQFTARHEHEA
jgi:hypothetical protein